MTAICILIVTFSLLIAALFIKDIRNAATLYTEALEQMNLGFDSRDQVDTFKSDMFKSSALIGFFLLLAGFFITFLIVYQPWNLK